MADTGAFGGAQQRAFDRSRQMFVPCLYFGCEVTALAPLQRSGSIWPDVGPAMRALSIHRPERHEVDRRAGDGKHLEKFAHLSLAGAGKPFDRRADFLLRRGVAVAAKGGSALEQAKSDEKIPLMDAAIDM